MNRLVRTELLKLRTTRAFVSVFIAAPLLAALMTTVIMGAAGRQGNDPLGPDSLLYGVGAPAAMVTLLALMLGLLGTAGEFRHGTITTTFLASPGRRDVVLSKLAAASIDGAAMSVLALAVSLAIAVPWLLQSGVAVRADGDLVGLAAGLVTSTVLYAALGVSIAALVRNQTAAAAAVLVWLLAIEGLVGDVFAGSAFVRYLPAAAGRALVHIGPGGGLRPPQAAAVFAAYVAVLALAAERISLRRDVT